MKSSYVKILRAVRALLGRVGLLRVLDRKARVSRTARWLRSLLAIYDVHDLMSLDTPWWTFESADLVRAHLAARPDARVFEWGSGASTAWLARRAGHVVAVEHDREWADQVRSLVPANATVQTVPPAPALSSTAVLSRKPGFEGLDFTSYVNAMTETEGLFDLIVIDGRAREACLKPALQRLADGGVIVFDNVDRSRYREAIWSEPGIEVVWTRGLTPCLPYPTRTALIRYSRPT